MSAAISFDTFNTIAGTKTEDAAAAATTARPLIVHMPVVHSLDADQIRTLRPELEALAEHGKDVLLDLRHIEFIDSSGVGCIVFLLKRLQSQSLKLKLRHVTGQPRQLIAMLRLNFLIEEKR